LTTGGLIKPGQLRVSFDAGSGYTVVTGNVDNDLNAELTIHLEGNISLTDSDFVF
jgi:hypothetical protein